MVWVLTCRNKSNSIRYYCKSINYEQWYDCDFLENAYTFATYEDADAMRKKLNAICKKNKWYGAYKILCIN